MDVVIWDLATLPMPQVERRLLSEADGRRLSERRRLATEAGRQAESQVWSSAQYRKACVKSRTAKAMPSCNASTTRSRFMSWAGAVGLTGRRW